MDHRDRERTRRCHTALHDLLQLALAALLAIGPMASCAVPRPATEGEIEREITRIDAGAPAFRQVARRGRSADHSLDVTGYFDGRDLVRVDEHIAGSDGARFRSRYYFWRGRLVAIDVDGVMLNRPSPEKLARSDFQWHYLFKPDGRLLTGRVTIEGHPMPPSAETVRAAWMKAKVLQERFARL